MRHRDPPRFSTAFVGRTDEAEAVTAAVRAGRMLTLVGPGGSGKTRLVVKVATEVGAGWPGEVSWIGLDAVADDSAVAARVAEVLGITARSGAEASAVTSTLARGRGLLVLDNCEQVRHGVRAFVDELLAAAPQVAVLATSRMPVGADAERVYRIGPMRLDDARVLLLSRAEAAGAPRPAETRARRICDRIDRLPLAIELAAGWMTTLSPDEIVQRLDQPLDLLESAEPRRPHRLRSLASSVRWSHELLDPTQRTVFRRLAVFQRGFTAHQAQSVCADAALAPAEVLKGLRGLVDASLLNADLESTPARYSMLDVIAAFSRAQLAGSGEEDAIRERHLATYRDAVERLLPLRESDKDTWRSALAPEYQNLVAAIEWGLSGGNVGEARDLAADLAWLWHLESRRPEGIRLLGAARTVAVEDPLASARAEVAFALVADTAAPEAVQDGTSALRRSIDDQDDVTARLARLLLALRLLAEDPAQARRLAHESRASAIAAGDVFGDHASAVLLGILHGIDDQHAEALDLLAPASEALFARGDRGVAATGLGYMALSTARAGDLDRAIEIARRAVDCAGPLHDLHRIGQVSVILAELLGTRGESDEAWSVIDPVAQIVEVENGPTMVPGWDLLHARMSSWDGRHEDALEWCRRGIRLAGDGAVDAGVVLVETQLEMVSALRIVGDADQATSVLYDAMQTIENMGQPRLRATALEQAALLERDHDAAYEMHQEALRLRVDTNLPLDIIDSLEHIAGLAAAHRSAELAVVLAAAADSARESHRYHARRTALVPRLTVLLADPLHSNAVLRGRELGLGAVGLARRMRGARNRPQTGWGSLTPTERSVVDLAAEGLSNPQIAEQLFIARGTVKTHLSHVYDKLGLRNRTELAAAHRAHRPTSPPAVPPGAGSDRASVRGAPTRST